MESALMAVGAIVAFMAIMAVGYILLSKVAERREQRRREEHADR